MSTKRSSRSGCTQVKRYFHDIYVQTTYQAGSGLLNGRFRRVLNTETLHFIQVPTSNGGRRDRPQSCGIHLAPVGTNPIQSARQQALGTRTTTLVMMRTGPDPVEGLSMARIPVTTNAWNSAEDRGNHSDME